MAAADGPRARYRAQTRDEIKRIALKQLAEGGIGAIALTRIAKELGLSGPALYRYYAGRDELLGELISEAYDDAAAEIARTSGARLLDLARAYRRWALTNPHRYLLIVGTPLPGYQAPQDTVRRARGVLGPFLTVFADADPGALPLVTSLGEWARQEKAVGEWVAEHAGDADPGVSLAGAVTAWARLHGVVSLEVEGHFGGMGFDPAALLEAEMNNLAEAFGVSAT